MFKIGIVGSDNSHGLAFAKLVNFKDEKTGDFIYPDARITAIYGLDKAQAESVAKEGAFSEAVGSAKDLIGKVDAVMVICRHGSLHAEYALPFIEAGMPVWVDKPFASCVKDAESMIEASKKKNTLLSGGSTTKLAKDVETLRYAVAVDSGLGKIKSGYMNFPGDVASEYDGIFFYGAHMAEMTLQIFGEGVLGVSTVMSGGELVAVAHYKDFYVIMNFVGGAGRYFGIVYGDKKTLVRDIDTSSTYRLGFDEFYNTLKTGKNPRPAEYLATPVRLLAAIEKSFKEKREVKISEV